ncbi:hypothetical protein [Acidicapsa ligni]|uniref:hypothetical protein n=1 Tax=Acidicapsa ligni TaxID=542300 RepID=UPI0021DF44F8|nr:hypothetical protein [Acidicapsa ligni]
MTRYQNYFNYFTEIEEHFQRRRGSLLLLSTLDWALIETWREAGIPLEIVLRGIDEAFDKYDARQRTSSRRVRQVNGLAWCAQAIMEAAEQQKEAAIGIAPAAKSEPDPGFESQRIADHLRTAAQALSAATIAPEACESLAFRLQTIADEILVQLPNLEDLERQLTVLEEKLFASLTTCVPEDLLIRLKAEAARELAAYRARMSAVQLRQIEQQFVHKRLLEHYSLPRLSLFYMRQA